MSNDAVVQVEVRTRSNGSHLVLWSYGYRAKCYHYEYIHSSDFDQFVKTCASEYVTSELGWNGAQLVSGPILIGPIRYALLFRGDGGEANGK
jgi:hypothetical protein